MKKSRNFPKQQKQLLVNSFLALLFTGCVAIGSSGCTLGPKFQRPVVMTAEEWRDLNSAGLVGEPESEIEWWKNLNDPVLDSLIATAFEENLSVQAAGLRVVQARVTRSGASWTQLPLITGQGSYSRSRFSRNVEPDVELERSDRQPRFTGPVATAVRDSIREEIRASQPTLSVNPEIDIYDVGVDGIWELDVWGKKRKSVESAQLKLQAAYASYDDIMVIIGSEVARTYILIRAVDQRIEAMNELVSQMQNFTQITKDRYERGESLITDVNLAELLTGIVETSLPQLEMSRRQLENSLCILLGRAPMDIQDLLAGTSTIPAPPAEAAVGIPADLLRRRPDVRMAEYLAAAQCARIGMAKADIMPSFSIFGGLGFRSSSSSNLFDSESFRSTYGGLVNINGLINYPIMVENVRLQDARFQEALLVYKETVLKANMEVENSIYRYIKAQEELAILENNLKVAKDTVELTIAAYDEGKVIVSVPLLALTFLAAQQDEYIRWQGEVATEYVSIYKGLGGGWETRIDKELVPEYIQEQMRKHADWWSFTGKRNISGRQHEKRRES